MELLVAVAIFVIVITIATDVYISTVGSQRKSFGLQDVLDSSRFSLESIARAVRQSSIVSVSPDSLEINHPEKGLITYELSSGKIIENGSALTSRNVVVEKLSFTGYGLLGDDEEQPRVNIVMKIRSSNQRPSEVSILNIQTTITPRKIQFN